MEKEIKNVEQFHIAFLEVLNKINAAMPGVHYDAPTRKEVEKSYASWKEGQKDLKVVLTDLLEKSKISKTDNTLLFTGVVAPPVAMIGKRAAGNIPALNFVKLVPDVVFVPSFTLLAVFGMKFARPKATAKTLGPAETQPSAASSGSKAGDSAAAPDVTPQKVSTSGSKAGDSAAAPKVTPQKDSST